MDCEFCASKDHLIDECPDVAISGAQQSQGLVSLARQTLPSEFSIEVYNAVVTIATTELVSARARYGPLIAVTTNKKPKSVLQYQISDGLKISYLDTSDENRCNWLALIPPATPSTPPNIICYQLNQQIFFSVTKDIHQGDKLYVWYSPGYANKFGLSLTPQDRSTVNADQTTQSEIVSFEAVVEASPSPVKRKRTWNCKACGLSFSNPRGLGSHKKICEQLTKNKEVVEDQKDIVEINVIIESVADPPKSPVSGPEKRKRTLPCRFKNTVMCKDSSLECELCDQEFDDKEQLDQHIQRDHLNEYTCPCCTLRFGTKTAIKYHTCKGEKILPDFNSLVDRSCDDTGYRCLKCQQVEGSLIRIRQHLLKYYKLFPCSICNEQFVTIPELEDHIAACSNVLSQNGELCVQCQLVFETEELLIAHSQIHSDRFQCERCERKHPTAYGLLHHLLSCNKDSLRDVETVCLMCNIVMASPEARRFHDVMSHDLFECKRCPETMQNQKDFEHHTAICSSKRKKQSAEEIVSACYCCSLCQLFFTKKDLLTHVEICSVKERPTEDLKCSICMSFSCQDVDTYKEHISREHASPYKCKKCDARFVKKIQLVKHRRNCAVKLDRINTLYSCPLCKQSFSRRDFFVRHECRDQDGFPIYRPPNILTESLPEHEQSAVCPKCGKSFSSSTNLTKHLKTHGDKEFSCDICSKKFFTKHAMLNHHDSMHTKKLVVRCEECNRTFRNKYSLRHHKRQFHNSIVKLYACPICNRTFRQNGNMQTHLLTHDDTNHFKCTICQKSFRYPERFNRHMVLHNKGRSLECNLCDRKFVMNYELNRHLKELHASRHYMCEWCKEVFRWRHTIQRHIRRKHSTSAFLADNTEYVSSLQCDRSSGPDYTYTQPVLSHKEPPSQTQVLVMFNQSSGESIPYHQATANSDQLNSSNNNAYDLVQTYPIQTSSSSVELQTSQSSSAAQITQQFTVVYTSDGQQALAPLGIMTAPVFVTAEMHANAPDTTCHVSTSLNNTQLEPRLGENSFHEINIGPHLVLGPDGTTYHLVTEPHMGTSTEVEENVVETALLDTEEMNVDLTVSDSLTDLAQQLTNARDDTSKTSLMLFNLINPS